ncbi:hypothetical protein [Vibrio parahaemolyticus]|uniref:hypothetical protein n=1 Tax=Vibrio parahaemolyticus TaxID=670 RepID=UPI00301C420E
MVRRKVSLKQKQRMQARKFNQAVAKSRGLEQALKNVTLELAKARKSSTPKQAQYALDELLKLDFAESLYRERYIRYDNNIFDNGRFPLIESSNESDLINWFSSFINFFSFEINQFVILRDKFYQCLLLEEYSKSKQLIIEIEEKFGKSLWSISAALSLDNFNDDIDTFAEKEKEYNSVEDKLSKTILLYSVAKASSLVSPERYNFSLGKMIEEMRLRGNRQGEESVLFRHNFDPAYDYKGIKRIINHDCDSRLLDMYSVFLRSLAFLYIKKTDLSEAKDSLISLKSAINDRALSKLIDRVLNVDCFDDIDKIHIEVSKNYYKGNYLEVISLCEGVLLERPYLSAFYEPYAKSLVHLNKTDCKLVGKLKTIIEIMCKIIRGESESVNNKLLTKIFHTLSYTHWSYSISAFLDTYSSELTNKVICSYDFNDSTSVRLSLFSMRDMKEEADLKDYEYEDYLMWRKVKLSADFNFYVGNYPEAIAEYRSLYQEIKNDGRGTSILARVAESYFLNGDINNAIVITSNEIREGRSINEYPLAPMADKIAKICKFSDDNFLLENYAIILNRHNRTVKPEYVQVVSNICENLLENYGIYSSEDFKNNFDKFSMVLLYDVFTTDVLDGMAIIFSSTQDYLLTRLSILQYISKTSDDKEVNQRASTEYKGVYQKLIAAVCSMFSGEGKISVDHAQLKAIITENVSQELSQLKEIKDRQLGHLPYPEQRLDADNNDEIEYELVKDEFHNKLHLLLLYILDEYTVNKLYGIDQSLNVGIRHGGIVNWLWSPLRSNNIAANKLSDGKFVADSAWKNKLAIDFNYYRDDVLDSIFEKILDFNKEISQLILKTKNRVHVSTGEFIEKDKLFNYYFKVDDIEDTGRYIDDFDADYLIDNVFEMLDLQTEDNMLSARVNFVPDLLSKIDALFNDFSSSIEKFNIEEVSNSIKNAHREIRDRVKAMEDWFDWQRGSAVDFKLAIALEKAKQVVEDIYKPLTLQLNGSCICNREFQGKHFSKVVSIFSLVLGNVCKHSSDEEDITSVSYKIRGNNEKVTISFSNDVMRVTDEIVGKINSINEEINKSFIDGATKEVGSGTYKIKRILSHEMQIKNQINVELKDKVFSIEIVLELGENEDINS